MYSINIIHPVNQTNWGVNLTEQEFQGFIPCLKGKKPVYFPLSLLYPVRTDKVNLSKDLFLPTTINQALKIKNIVFKVFAVLIALVFDIPTFPIRLLTCIPRMLHNAKQEPSELWSYLWAKEEVNRDLIASDYLLVEVINPDKTKYQVQVNIKQVPMRVAHITACAIFRLQTITALALKFFSQASRQPSGMNNTVLVQQRNANPASKSQANDAGNGSANVAYSSQANDDSIDTPPLSPNAPASTNEEYIFDPDQYAKNVKNWNDNFKKNIADKNVHRWKESLKIIFNSTLKCFLKKSYYLPSGEKINLDPNDTRKMIDNTELYDPQPLAAQESKYQTVFEVVEEDSFDLAKRYQEEGYHPAVLNMANSITPGGGVRRGARAQEECLCRRSNYILAMDDCKDKHPNYLQEGWGHIIYTPGVTVIRSREADMKKNPVNSYEIINPYQVDMIACAAIYLKPGQALPSNFEERTKQKIRSILRAAAQHGHDALVLGALGCGAFSNSPEIISRYFREIFEEPEFKGRFKKVGFGILYDQKLLDVFNNEMKSMAPADKIDTNSKALNDKRIANFLKKHNINENDLAYRFLLNDYYPTKEDIDHTFDLGFESKCTVFWLDDEKFIKQMQKKYKNEISTLNVKGPKMGNFVTGDSTRFANNNINEYLVQGLTNSKYHDLLRESLRFCIEMS
jgi:uncharacterized protein (TIGR02452 family)